MISLLATGDTDILRDATQASTVFWHRVRNAPLKVGLLAALTLILVVLLVLMVGGGFGIAWARPALLAIPFTPLLLTWFIYIGWLLYQFMPGRNDRIVLALRAFVRQQVDTLDEQLRALDDGALRAKRGEFEQRLADGETLDDIRAEAYAVVREASRRARAHRQFECQVIGGKVIESGTVAEMRTGEGKTIVCYLANYMKVLQGLKVHMVTVNDYLVRRDAEFCTPIFDLLGVTVGFISNEMDAYGAGAQLRQQMYGCDITYGTNSEFGFDFLRDNMKRNVSDLVQGRQDFAVVDEVDSILIDEARTPLIIAGPAHDDITFYQRADAVARSLMQKQQQANQETARNIDALEANPPEDILADPKTKSHFEHGLKKFRADPAWLSIEEAEAIGHMQYYVVELDRKHAHMTEHGAKAAQAELGLGSFFESRNMNWPHYIDNSLRAHTCYQRDKDYVIESDEIVIVDEFTGRLMYGRHWSDGLHQACEAKERVQIKQQTQTVASITLQNLFKMYKQLAGMTGTAMTEADEFQKIYGLDVVAVPTNKPVRRIDYNDKIYKSIDSKFNAIVEEIRSHSLDGYPADAWSQYDALRDARKILKDRAKNATEAGSYQAAITEVDNAIKTFDEGAGDASALEKAYLHLAEGQVGPRPVLVGTVSVESSEKLSQVLTQRHGVDHEVLNAKNHAREAEIIKKAGFQHEQVRGAKKQLVGNVTIATNMAGRGTDIVLGEGVAKIGGLHVVGTERHESRRIDNQLRGRSGRQGDPGSSRFFLSFEDELIKLFMNEWMLKMLNRFALEEGVPIEHRSLTKGIERAQKKVEERNFNIRKMLLDYDEVPDEQRRRFYALRKRVLFAEGLTELIWEMIDESVADAVERYYDDLYPAQCAAEWASAQLGISIDPAKLDTSDFALIEAQARDEAIADTRSHIVNTFGEYVDESTDQEEWDIRGLIGWAQQYGVSFTQRQVKETHPDELRDRVVDAALSKIEDTDLGGLRVFTERAFARGRLIAWANEKFGVEIEIDELMRTPQDEAEQLILNRMRDAYKQREIEYPANAIVRYAMNVAGQNRTRFYEQVAKWTNLKFRSGWTYEHFEGKTPQQVFEELRDMNADFLQNGRLDAEVDAAMKEKQGEELAAWARERFGSAMGEEQLDLEGDIRTQLKQFGYQMLRFELTQLERLVLLETLDAVWKDHMYAMDLLRGGIGLRGYAERDPKIEFKREGTRLFNELMANIRARVTDLAFRVQISLGQPGQAGGGAAAAGGAPSEPVPSPDDGGSAVDASKLQARHDDATGAAYRAAETDDQAAAQQQGESGAKPIRREEPRVGRNDPCPCGSGKKYKQCCGKQG